MSKAQKVMVKARKRKGISDSITVVILLIVAVSLTLSVALLGFTMFRSYSSQSVLSVKGIPTLSFEGGKVYLNVTVVNYGSQPIYVTSATLGATSQFTNSSLNLMVPGSSSKSFVITFSVVNISQLDQNKSLIPVSLQTSSSLEPVLYFHALVS